ncbi:hypothetical protein [Acidisoma silvae]|uniref:Uncharacterized protein n=1 Tax=Acidisoma silvae TaxID=2802396 RepID=A0A963YNL2_9PROT|nr:hypothetical protein [Acidisoma silvae]MCB8874213.1 hypothetical protein [Acidisoma silvae]
MSDAPDNILLAYMRRFDEKLDRVIDVQTEHSSHLSQLEFGLVGLRRDMVQHAEGIALLGVRLDRADKRLDRIEKRLGLIEV